MLNEIARQLVCIEKKTCNALQAIVHVFHNRQTINDTLKKYSMCYFGTAFKTAAPAAEAPVEPR